MTVADVGPATTVRTVGHWIGGRGEYSSRTLPVLDPATGAAVADMAVGSAETVARAVAAAQDSWPQWRDRTIVSRTRVLARWAALVREHTDELAASIALENGKTLDDARGELARGADALDAAVAGGAGLKGELVEQTGSAVDTAMTLHSLGVCVGISPFNFPVMVPLAQASFALAAGNTFVLKPSEQDPGPALRIAELATQARIPDGVFNVVNGDRVTVEHLIDHPNVAAVAFVGSTPTARSVYARAAANGKRAQAFGGAKNHLVVMPDANLAAAADAVTSAAFGSAGQRCMAVTTAVAVGDVADRLVRELAIRARAIRIGAAHTTGTEMGPLISKDAQTRVRDSVSGAIADGAVAVVDRSTEQPDGHPDGFFAGPAILDHVTADMEVYRHEVFGPVLGIVRVDSFDDAVTLIENNPYGNGSAIFTSDGASARAVQRRVPTGMVGINVPIPVPVATFGFAGWKASAFGDTGLHDASWRFYTRPKYVTSRWDESRTGIDLGFRPN
ncbi:MAG: CoA-acylating methylmalonate-semialdehyde dehydrogenase [Rhodococcus sp. (in: high G+C Gram-positive bacteria)]